MSPIQRNSLLRLVTIEPVPASIIAPGSTSMTRVIMSVQTSVATAAETFSTSSTPTELSSSTTSSTGSLTASKNTQAPSLPTNATLFGAAPRSGANLRIPIFAIVLLSIFAILLLTATIYLVRFRRGACEKHHQVDFERRMEVIEARAIMPKDGTLRRSYSRTPLFGGEDTSEGKELTTLTRVYSNEDLNHHPLFHADIKKSRTLSYNISHPRPTGMASTSYNTMSSRIPRIELPISPVSPRTPSMTRALSQYTTMQTRQPKTFSVPIGLPEIQNEFAAFCQNPAVRSIWSTPRASAALSSPSIYSETALRERRVSLSPMPARPTDLLPIPIESDENNREGSTVVSELLVQPLNIPSSNANQPRTSVNLFALYGMNFNAAPLVPSQQISYSPVHSFINAPAEPEPSYTPPTRRPSLAELNAMSDDMSLDCPLGLERVNGEVKIERWLEGNMATLTALAYQSGAEDGLSRGRRLSFVERGRRRSVKLSPIRGMQPSWARRGSAAHVEADG